MEQLAGETGCQNLPSEVIKREDYKDISHHAINRLADFYGVTADYLLARTETKRHPNAALSDLHLSDEMIELLKSKWVDVARAEIMEKYQPAEQDKTMYLLQSAYVEEGAAFEGSRTEQLLMVFCKQTKLRYNKLTEDEKQALIQIVQKSELMKSAVSQRGRKK